MVRIGSRYEDKLKKDEWYRQMRDPEFRLLTAGKQAEFIGVSGMTISRWRKGVSDGQWETWRSESQRVHAKQEVAVDDSVYKQAIKGDITAAKLFYQKVLGWSEKKISENINRDDY